ncbi:endoglucanase 7 [Physcomitrium patens]|uniref:Endoglucanase n=1 Tax=Physcomitrium patens TaxID=3218 RepID=A0A2K1IB94_PHYPA|nr:endoglucanase 7-like [Physcomitrium patens]PNR26539.1 hypothetical protein PHYPA_030019 [Physcomitrium patens]|eukprot:XP_024366977.1 endoglucanase 7-like [Physcomitrella patens]
MGVNGAYVLLGCVFGLLLLALSTANAYDYGDALDKAVKYFEAQRSGRLPPGHRVSWRGDSGLHDGQQEGLDLSGGYYDAGDNVKFGLPMAYTITMLSWSVIEYKHQLQASRQLDYALEAIKWGTDYFIKAHPEPNVLWGEVGDGDSDHDCWMRPEDMTTSRKAYKIDSNNPGSDLAGETSAAMAAASIVFKQSDPEYSATLLRHARELFTFADTYRGTYDNSIPVAKKYYKSWSGFNDELLWAAEWLYDATGDAQFLEYFGGVNAANLGGTGWALNQFSWDNKYVGVQLKATKLLLDGRVDRAYIPTLQLYKSKVEYFLCAALQKNAGEQITKSPGGMFWIQTWNNMQYVTSAAFLLTVASDYYEAAHATLSHCTSPVTNSELLAAGKEQVDYILGNNNRGQSYMIGFGNSYPQRVHHRAASIPEPVACKEGFDRFYFTQNNNPHVIEGAITGGPDANDNYNDQRNQYAMSEPVLYNTAPLVGTLARLSQGRDIAVNTMASAAFGSGLNQDVVAIRGSHESRRTRRRPNRKRGQSNDCISITQSLIDKWTAGRHVYFKSAGKITNNCKTRITGSKFVVRNLYGTLWGLHRESENGNMYTLPDTKGTLEVGESIYYSYIQKRPFKARIVVLAACPTCAAQH